VQLINAIGAGAVSLLAAAGLAAPAYAAPQAALRADGCAVHVNILHPHAGQTETLAVTSKVGKTTVQVTIHYKTVTHVWKFTTPASTKTTFTFGVGRPNKNYRVNLNGKVIAVPRGYQAGSTCATSFVPE
jgi:hypothetical protein